MKGQQSQGRLTCTGSFCNPTPPWLAKVSENWPRPTSQQLVHLEVCLPSVGEEEGRVIERDGGGGRDEGVFPVVKLRKVVDEGGADLGRGPVAPLRASHTNTNGEGRVRAADKVAGWVECAWEQAQEGRGGDEGLGSKPSYRLVGDSRPEAGAGPGPAGWPAAAKARPDSCFRHPKDRAHWDWEATCRARDWQHGRRTDQHEFGLVGIVYDHAPRTDTRWLCAAGAGGGFIGTRPTPSWVPPGCSRVEHSRSKVLQSKLDCLVRHPQPALLCW